MFSVITPTYNGASTIATTIERVLSQVGVDLEHVIVDDCSTDATREIVASYARHDARVKLVVMPRNSGGPAGPKSEGIRTAKGEFVAFCDQDDRFLPGKLARLRLAFDHPSTPDVVFSDYLVFDETGAFRQEPYLRSRRFTEIAAPYLQRTSETEYACTRLHACMLTGVATGMATIGTAVRRSALVAEPYLFSGEFRIADDIDMWIRLAARRTVLYVDEALSEYFWGAQTLSSNPVRYARETLQVWRVAYDAFQSTLDRTERRLARRYGANLMYGVAKYSPQRGVRLRLATESLRTAWNPLAARLLVTTLLTTSGTAATSSLR